MKVSTTSKVAMTGIALMFLLMGAVEAFPCDYNTMNYCTPGQVRWIVADKSQKRSIQRAETANANRVSAANRRALQKAEKNQRRGKSTIVYYSDGTWTEVRHARRRW